MNLFLTRMAQTEFREAFSYYDELAPTLANQLVAELENAQKRILSFPLAWSKAGKSQRKYILQKFPYMLIYKVFPDRIVVTAFAHSHREPESYIGRKAVY